MGEELQVRVLSISKDMSWGHTQERVLTHLGRSAALTSGKDMVRRFIPG